MKYNNQFFLFFVFCGFLFAVFLHHQYFKKNIVENDIEFYISKKMDFDQLIFELDSISSNMHPIAKLGLCLFANQKRLDYWFVPGRYIFDKSFSMNDIVNKLRSRVQDPVHIVFNSMDNVLPILGIVGSQLDLDSLELIHYLDSVNLPIDSLYFTFIPNTYEVFWNISPENFFTRMTSEYIKFWNLDRISAAKRQNLSKHEVFILASIVDKEASHFDEMPRIAGLYLNRLKKGWPLASDPTIIYIWKQQYNKVVRRVRNKHIEDTKKSIFNTYHHKGLPPFPICVPSFQAIESVLNPEKHKYMYMCARPDNSEYHNFSQNYFDHQLNANAFHRWLDKRKIY